MKLTIIDLFENPDFFLFGFEGDHARFVQMDRQSYHDSVFFDRRIKVAREPMIRVPIEALLAYASAEPLPPRRFCWIHHVAQCGSTLLARAIDMVEKSLVIREPQALRQLGVHAGTGFKSANPQSEWQTMLDLVATMLNRRYDVAAPVVIKGNVPTNFIADALMKLDPSAPTILLHFGLENYLAAIMRTPDHERWVESVTGEIKLAENPLVGNIDALTTAQKGAALWFVQMKLYEQLASTYDNVRTIDADLLFSRPCETILATRTLFGIGLSEDEVKLRVESDLFRTYSKNPAVAYGADTRLERRAEAKQRLSSAIAEAREWVDSRIATHGLVDALSKPLLGDPSPLLD